MSRKQNRKEYIAFVLETAGAMETPIQWKELYERVKEKYPEHATAVETVRSVYRYHSNESGYKTNKEKDYTSLSLGAVGIDDKIMQTARAPHEIQQLASRLNIGVEKLLTEVSKLELNGVIFHKWLENGKSMIQLHTTKLFPSYDSKTVLETAKEIKFLVIGDTHFGHKKSQRQITQDLITKMYSEGVRHVFHTGDILEGHYQAIRPTSILELDAIGYDDQIGLALETLPELEGLQYYAITGK